MTSLESIVLPLEQSRALVEHGIVLDTVASWITDGAKSTLKAGEFYLVPKEKE